MDNLKAKKEERVGKEDAYTALVNKAKTGTLSADEIKQLGVLEGEISSLDGEIDILEKSEETAKRIAKRQSAITPALPGAPQDDASSIKELNKISAKYSFAKQLSGVNTKKDGYHADGVEKEMYEEAVREAKEAGVSVSGNIAIPSTMIRMKSALNVATEGTDVVAMEMQGLIPILLPDPVTARLGITVLNGLRGDIQFPRQNGDIAFAWEGESDSTAAMTPTFNNIQMSPNRVAGYIDVSDKMLRQSSFVIEPFIRAIIERRYALTVDDAVIDGAGTGDEPTGIFNYSGVNVLSLGSAGGDMTFAALTSMIRDTHVDNARDGKNGFLTNSNGEYALSVTSMQSSGVEGNFIYKFDGRLVGRPLFVSNIVRNDYTEGAGSNLSGIIYGNNWSSAMLGAWGGLDILFDPYTQALTAQKRFVVNAWLDVEIQQAEEFCICKDWITTTPALT